MEHVTPRTFDRRHRARFDALRNELFADMGQAAARWRLNWVIPFNVFVVALLFVRGESPARVVIQTGALLMATASFFVRATRKRRPMTSLPGLCVGAVTCLVAIGNTGGLASPL